MQMAQNRYGYKCIKHATQSQKAEMKSIIEDENQFQIQDFHPEMENMISPETRILTKNTSGYAVEATMHFEDGDSKYYEQIGICVRCGKMQIVGSTDNECCYECGKGFDGADDQDWRKEWNRKVEELYV
jgi:hypothetical protein